MQGMNSIDKETVKHMAALSRLSLTEEEVAHYAEQLSAILDYASNLPEVEAEVELGELRTDEDIAKPTVDPHDLLRNAVAMENGFVKVPAILNKNNDN